MVFKLHSVGHVFVFHSTHFPLICLYRGLYIFVNFMVLLIMYCFIFYFINIDFYYHCINLSYFSKTTFRAIIFPVSCAKITSQIFICNAFIVFSCKYFITFIFSSAISEFLVANIIKYFYYLFIVDFYFYCIMMK